MTRDTFKAKGPEGGPEAEALAALDWLVKQVGGRTIRDELLAKQAGQAIRAAISTPPAAVSQPAAPSVKRERQAPPNEQWCVGCTPEDCVGCGPVETAPAIPRAAGVTDAQVKRAVQVFAHQPSGSYDDGAEERLMRAVLEDSSRNEQPKV